jgi:DNA polymerase
MQTIALPRIGTFDAWRDAARRLLTAGTQPEDILWTRGESAPDLFAPDLFATPGPTNSPPKPITAPKAFLPLAKLVACHSDPERFARLYAMLHALQGDKHLLSDRADPRVTKLNMMAKQVSRDRHKMTAFLRFRDVTAPGANRRRFAAWFEPSHFIMELTAPFFANRFGDMDWTIFTPDITAHFDGEITFREGTAKPPLPEDATEELWRTYYRSIFNPARLKTQAMQSEMPRKYWKNLPEADLIPDLIATAEARAREMAEKAPTLTPARAAPILQRLHAEQAQRLQSLDRFTAALQECRRCPLHGPATQAVPGEGPLDAALMIVGEQPGDREDLTGRPFTGPAGQLLDKALKTAGIDRSQTYVTNAVKHFKFRPKGKGRLHQTPDGPEILACKWWLDLEIQRVSPDLILALGATALHSLTGSRKDLLKRRGTLEESADGQPLFITVHPSYILRLPDPAQRQAEEARFIADLQSAKRLLPAN